MEFQTKDVAKLVLGYLREEKCPTAFTEFLRSSKYLQDCHARNQRGKPIVTRIFGLSLVDYLTEYALIYTIVLERIELTDYYINNPSKRATIVQQLLYLLGGENVDSRAASPAHDLSIQSINKSQDFQNSVDKSTNTDDENLLMQDKYNISQEVFTQTFLENTEFHRKLADNINKTVSELTSPETSSGRDLDTAIKRIVKSTEQDPIFHRLIDEILVGTENTEFASDGNDSGPEINKLTDSDQLITLSEGSSKTCDDDENIRQRIANLNYQDEADSAAIATIAVIENVQNEASNTSDAILSQNNQIFSNTSTGLLMLQPQNSGILTTVAKIDAPKPYCVIGTQPYLGMQQLNTVYTEQDILTMPTIFVCDNNSQVTNTQTIMNIAPASVRGTVSNFQVPSTTEFKKIAPKIAEQPKSLSEFISTYKFNDPSPIKELKSDRKRSTKQKNIPSVTKSDSVPLEIAVESILPQLQTPDVKIPSKETRSRTTPHSGGSHIRQLDFSTPNRKGALKANQDKKRENRNVLNANRIKSEDASTENSVSSSKVNNLTLNTETKLPDDHNVTDKQPTDATVTLPKSGETLNAAAINKSTSPCSWDADLRVLTATAKEELPPKLDKDKPKRKRKTSRNATSTSKKAKTNDPANESKRTAVEIEETQISPAKNPSSVQETNTSASRETNENKFEFLNRNGKPRYKKKCNINSNDAKNASGMEQTVLTSIARVASCEIIDDVKNKVILSPSKMNASKRNIINADRAKDEQKNSSDKHPTFEAPKNPTISSKAMPLLETPVKRDFSSPPKTPGPLNSSELGTTFANAIIDQLHDVDLCAIQTPVFPITPNFGLTPHLGRESSSGVKKGGTDYSTGSSYYQPSDEQNKSLDQLLEECKKLDDELPQKNPVISKDALPFYRNVAAPTKNLHLVKASTDVSDSSSSTSISDSDSNNSSESSVSDFQGPADTPSADIKHRYSFRPRKNATAVSDSEPPKKLVKTHQEMLLQEMEEKRQRTIARFKKGVVNEAAPKTKKPLAKSNAGTRKKISACKKTVNSSSESDRAVRNNTEVMLHLVSDDDEMQIEPFEVVETNLRENSSSSTPIPEYRLENQEPKKDKVNEDRSADFLIQSLKERGIHLVPNKKGVSNSLPSTKTENVKELDVTNNVETLLAKKLLSLNSPEGSSDRDKPSQRPVEEHCSDQTNMPSDEESIENLILHLKETSSSFAKKIVEPKSKQNENPLSSNQQILKQTLNTSALTEAQNPPVMENKQASNATGAQTLLSNNLPISAVQPGSNRQNDKLKEPYRLISIDLEASLEEGEILTDDEKPKKPRVSSSASRSHKRSDHRRTRDRYNSCKKPPAEVTSMKPSTQTTKLAKEDTNELFTVKNFNKETISVKHDYHKKCTRTLADYNLDILQKTISASVYITEHDLEVTKLMTFSPTEYVLDIPAKNTKDNNSISILHNELVKPSTSTSRTSNLDGLYPEQTSRYKSNSNDIKYKIAERKYSEKAKQNRSSERLADKPIHTKSPTRSKTVERVITKCENMQSDVSDIVKPSERIEASPSNINDDLMNYAIVGSVRDATADDFEFSLENSFKKQMSEDRDNKKNNPKDVPSDDAAIRCHELLRNIDVDSFLEKLHGDTL